MNDNQLTWEEAVEWLRSQPDQAGLVKACYYDDPLHDAAARFHQSTEWKEIQRRLPEQRGRVLDLGAGRGISAFAFARDGWGTIAVEPDRSAIVGARAIEQLSLDSGLPIQVVQALAETLPFRDNTFDVVYGRQILHHANDLTSMCNEISRVLKPGGIFIATREHVISSLSDLNLFSGAASSSKVVWRRKCVSAATLHRCDIGKWNRDHRNSESPFLGHQPVPGFTGFR